MGWGAPFNSLWNAATDVAKSTVTAAAKTAVSAYDYTKKSSIAAYKAAENAAVAAYDYAEDKAVAGYNYVEAKAIEGYNFAERKAVEGYELGKAAVVKTADVVIGVGKTVGNIVMADAALISRKASAAFAAAKEAMGLNPAGSPTAPCPHQIDAKTKYSDTDRDGWFIVPQGDDKPCLAMPPGKSSSETNVRFKAAQSRVAPPMNDCCQKKREAGLQPRNIVFVNGIQNDSEDHCATLKAIARQTCANVTGIYNATAGKGILGFLSDVLQTRKDRQLVETAAGARSSPTHDGRNPSVDTLTRVISKQAQEGKPQELWFHSQGAAVGSLALAQARNALAFQMGGSPLANVEVKSFGGAAPMWVGVKRSQHFVHLNDPVPTLLGVGPDPSEAKFRAGATSRIVHFSGDPSSTEPFAVANRERSLMKTNLGNHGMIDSYLKMEKQQNGGCD